MNSQWGSIACSFHLIISQKDDQTYKFTQSLIYCFPIQCWLSLTMLSIYICILKLLGKSMTALSRITDVRIFRLQVHTTSTVVRSQPMKASPEGILEHAMVIALGPHCFSIPHTTSSGLFQNDGKLFCLWVLQATNARESVLPRSWCVNWPAPCSLGAIIPNMCFAVFDRVPPGIKLQFPPLVVDLVHLALAFFPFLVPSRLSYLGLLKSSPK